MNQIFDIKRVLVDDIDVAYCQFGGGKQNVVICQGWGTDFKMYKIMADAISDKCTVTLFDFPGFGMTREPINPWTVGDYSQFLLHFLSALSIDKCSLVGHSFGGRVAIETAASSPSSLVVEKLVLVDSAGVMPKRGVKSNVRVKFFKAWRKFITSPFIYPLFPEVIDDWIDRQGSEDYRAASKIMKQVLVKAVNYDQCHLFPLVEQPVLLIWGENDDATPLDDAHIMEKGFKDAGLVVIKGAGHFSYAENPSLFSEVLRSFLIGNDEQ